MIYNNGIKASFSDRNIFVKFRNIKYKFEREYFSYIDNAQSCIKSILKKLL